MKKISFIVIILWSLASYAQQVKDSVKTEVIEVTRSFDPKVQDAYKLDVNPEIDATPEAKIPLEYHIQSVPVASTFQPEKGSMAGFNPGGLDENYHGSYVSLAGGNYTQIKGDAYVYYPVSEKLDAALILSHYSSQGKETDEVIYNPFYHTAVNAVFNYKSDENSWLFDLGYNGHINRLKKDTTLVYFNPPAIATNTNTYNNFGLKVKGSFKDFLFKDLELAYNNFWDGFDNSEHFLQMKTNLIIPVGDLNLKLGLQSDMVTGNAGKLAYVIPLPDYKLEYQNMDAGLLPAIQIENDNLVANLGAKIFYQNNSAYKKIQFIPDVNVHLNLIYERLTVFGGVTGDLQQNSQKDYYTRNPYIGLTENIKPTLIPYDIFGGFHGAFSGSVSYEIRMGVRKINNYGFYQQNTMLLPLAGYSVLYDDMTQSYFKTDLNLGVGRKMDLKLGLTYMQNKTDQLKKPLFIPDFDFKSVFIFKPTEKLNVNLTLNSVGKRNYVVTGDKSLKAFTDLNLGIRYRINKEFTAFAEAYNLLNQEYEIYKHYPVQKLQIMGGVSYRFDIPSQK